VRNGWCSAASSSACYARSRDAYPRQEYRPWPYRPRPAGVIGLLQGHRPRGQPPEARTFRLQSRGNVTPSARRSEGKRTLWRASSPRTIGSWFARARWPPFDALEGGALGRVESQRSSPPPHLLGPHQDGDLLRRPAGFVGSWRSDPLEVLAVGPRLPRPVVGLCSWRWCLPLVFACG